MKDAFTLGELVAMGLPGYPSTRQGWRLMVEKRGWKVVRLDVPGGRKNLYFPPLLTLEAINANVFEKTVQGLCGGAFSAEYVESARARRNAKKQARSYQYVTFMEPESTEKKNPPVEPTTPTEVATEVMQFLVEKYGAENLGNNRVFTVVEGLWLAMQMANGPQTAANVINQCAIKVA